MVKEIEFLSSGYSMFYKNNLRLELKKKAKSTKRSFKILLLQSFGKSKTHLWDYQRTVKKAEFWCIWLFYGSFLFSF